MIKPIPTLCVVRLINKESDPMIGVVCPLGQAGTPCWDYEHRKLNPHTQVLVQPKTYSVIGPDPKSGQR